MTCGSLAGSSIGVIPSFSVGGSHYTGIIPYLQRRHASKTHDDATPVDDVALGDPAHPGHGEAVKLISYLDTDQREETVHWLEGLLQDSGNESGPLT